MNTTKRVLLRTSIVLVLSALVSLWAMPETDLLAADVIKPAQANVHVPSGEAPCSESKDESGKRLSVSAQFLQRV